MSQGHLFVVRGRIGGMVADASVISTDRFFTVEKHWYGAIGATDDRSARRHRPPDWDSRSWGRSATDRPFWFLNVTNDEVDGKDQFDRLADVLADIADTRLGSAVKKRPMPLVVLPVIATKGGGMQTRRGEVVDRLLEVCRRFVADHSIDVAIAAPNQAAHAALQHGRREAVDAYFPDPMPETVTDLADRARKGSLALFMGAGTSIPAGAPSWDELIAGMAAEAELADDVRSSLGNLSALDQAELLQRKLGPDRLVAYLNEVIGARDQPALSHVLLAALGCESAVTTNYDQLYELAVENSGDATASVLPSELPTGGSRWILKMHGDLRSPGSVVLTRGEFVAFAAGSGPAGSVLQSLLLTKHVLVVGASMTDDNLLRLIHEVAGFRHRHRKDQNSVEQFGTILDISGDAARRELHSRHFCWQDLPGESMADRARQLEIFLDAVAMWAASDHSWLLDPQFEHLHPAERRELARRVRALADEVRLAAQGDDAWAAFARQMERFGAPASRPGRSH